MHNFTPISALIGGSLIGLSAVLFMALNGRVAGISGMIHGLFVSEKKERLWRACFLVGLIAGSVVYYFFPQIQFTPRQDYPIFLLLVAGFLVGLGTYLSRGCTSGHGVCGMARLSPRSVSATLIFFSFGLLTTALLKHHWGLG